MRDGGKGDKPRPLSVPMEEFDNRWETIFGNKSKQEIDDARAEDEAFEDIARKQN